MSSSDASCCSFPGWLVEQTWTDGRVVYETEQNHTLSSYRGEDRWLTLKCLQIDKDHSHHHHHLLLQPRHISSNSFHPTNTTEQTLDTHSQPHHNPSIRVHSLYADTALFNKQLSNHSQNTFSTILLSPITPKLTTRISKPPPRPTDPPAYNVESFTVLVQIANQW